MAIVPESDLRVAVVVLTWNRRAELLRNLARLVSLPERPKVIVVDNGSRDGTGVAVAEQFPAVEVIQAGTNRGAAARNIGVARARQPYVALCDDDVWWEAGSLRRAADLFDKHSRLAIACAKVMVEPGAREDPVCRLMAESPLPEEDGMPGPRILGFLAGASVVRRGAFLEAGGFPTDLGIGGEEQWLAAELASRRWWLCYVSEIVAHHQPSSLRSVSRRRRRLLRNAIWFAWLRRPLPSALRSTIAELRRQPKTLSTAITVTAAFAGLLPRLGQRREIAPDVEDGFRILESLAHPRPPQHLRSAIDDLRPGSQGDVAATGYGLPDV